ncbi:MAG TPA: hypothetical protein VKQ72_06860 [Aggregatilineales bacterium]|nr:hypothetical protein [Aggregatilineales bacterium]
MVEEVKIIWFGNYDTQDITASGGANATRLVLSSSNAETTLKELLNKGWVIIASGGDQNSFVILKREK